MRKMPMRNVTAWIGIQNTPLIHPLNNMEVLSKSVFNCQVANVREIGL